MTVQFKIDTAVLENVKAALLDKSGAKIGVFGAEGGIAIIHEFGATAKVTPKMIGYFKRYFGVNLGRAEKIVIPPRPFLRPVGENESGTFQEFLRKHTDFLLSQIVSGGWGGMVRLFALEWVDYVKKAFNNNGWGRWASLSSFTVTYGPPRPSAHPLIVTGKLKNAITVKMEYK
jgi:hypothetical protein